MAEPEKLGTAAGNLETQMKQPWDPAPARERIRGWIAMGLVILLAVVIVGPLFVGLFWPNTAQNVERMISLLLGPLVGLVGTVLGFYFGGRDRG